jgi:hypothetical protein
MCSGRRAAWYAPISCACACQRPTRCGDSSSRFAELIDQQPMQTVPTKNVIAPCHSPGHQTSAVRASVVARCHTDPMADPPPLKRGFIVVVETPQSDGRQLSRRGYLVAAESESSVQAAAARTLGKRYTFSAQCRPSLSRQFGAAWSGIATGRLKPAPRIPDGYTRHSALDRFRVDSSGRSWPQHRVLITSRRQPPLQTARRCQAHGSRGAHCCALVARPMRYITSTPATTAVTRSRPVPPCSCATASAGGSNVAPG